MTDTSAATTHPIPNPYPVTAPLASPVPNGTTPDTVYAEDEEPYTIKCICAFEDDDGNTVFCEGCETWQHIECYYHGQDVPEVHNCADCEPRPLDGKRATERQKKLREQSDGGDRKSKRTGTKKKKSKDAITDQTNGWISHERGDSVAKEPPVKKAKTGHRASHSISSLSQIPNLQPDRKRSGSVANLATSPTKSSSRVSSTIPLYSNDFIHLYDRDQGKVNMQSNLFDNLTLAGDLASWVQDPDALAQVTNGRSPKDVFTYSEEPIDPTQWPAISTQTIVDSNVEIDGRHPTWQLLKLDSGVRKDEIVGEVRGKIGLLRDYCLDPQNRWQELRHPEPFVFFHPQLPIYIDSRHEGTQLRYVRRSCRPNVTLKTFITNEVEYHFCFVATQDIPADAEITAMWYLDPQLFPSNNGFVKQETSNDGVQDAAAVCISNVLSHFGGCACSLPTCLLNNVDRRRTLNAKQANGRRRKTKSKNMSPPGSGLGSRSRAGSEGTRLLDDDDQAESRSTSGSLRGHSASRDLTPTNEFAPELSARDRRKIAAVEKKFEQLDKDQQHPRGKKRRGTGSTQTTPVLPSSKHFGIDTAIAGRPSRSPPLRVSPSGPGSRKAKATVRKASGPNTPTIPSPLCRPLYADSGTQTEPDENDPNFKSPRSYFDTKWVHPKKRLFQRFLDDRERILGIPNPARRVSSPGALLSPTSPSVHVDETPSPLASTTIQQTPTDLEMKDVDHDMPPPRTSASNESFVEVAERRPLSPSHSPDGPVKPSLPVWPSAAAHYTPIARFNRNGIGSQLRVQLPATPALETPNSITSTASMVTPVEQSPLSAIPVSTQPLLPPSGGGVVAPSPAKKKLSLGDYLSRKGTLTTPTSEKSQAQAMLTQSSTAPNQPPSLGERNWTASGAAPKTPSAEFPIPTHEETKPENLSPDVAMNDVPSVPSSPPYVPTLHPTTVMRDPRLPPPS